MLLPAGLVVVTESLWVAVLNISVQTASKLVEKHHLDPDAVRRAVKRVAGLEYVSS